MPENKVKYGLNNAHYAVLTSDTGGKATFEKPKPIPGAVNLSLDAQGELTEFYADNMAYYVTAANDGYSGNLEVAQLPDSFREDVLNEKKDAGAGTLTENSTAEPKPFALLFDFAGDAKAVHHVLYNCSATRPSVSGATTGKSKEPTTESLSIKASPLTNGNVKAKTTGAEDGTAYATWFSDVWQPSEG